jgi:hypothetical protein
VTAGWSRHDPRTLSRLGWNWVSTVRLASPVRFWSKPVTCQLGGDLVGQVQGAQGVAHGAGGARDDGCVLRVGLGLAGVKVGDPPHRQYG